jgi:hypothetical protein
VSTFKELQTQIVANFGNRNDATTLSQVMTQTNLVLQMLAAANEWDELQASTTEAFIANQWEYTPTQLGIDTLSIDRIYTIQVNDDTRWMPPMTRVTNLVWNRDHLPNVSLNARKPTHFTVFGGKYYFSPTPDHAYSLKIDYYSKVTKITNTGSTICLVDKDELIIGLTTALMWLTIGESETAGAWMKLCAPLADQFNIDSKRFMNLVPAAKAGKVSTNRYNDPFARR